ncbi:MAG: hypothetical protein ACJAVK_001218 [Akkermansiaceae bacterium]|jgi:hypothetical protein
MNDPSAKRSNIIGSLRSAGRVFASHRAYVRLLRSVKFLLAAVITMALLDILFHLSPVPRILLLSTFILSGIALLGLAIHTMIWRRPSLDDTARDLEKLDLALGSKLTNVLQLHAQANDPEAAPLTRDLAKRAVADSAKQVTPRTLPALARFAKLGREFKIAFSCLAAFALIIFLIGQPAYRQLARLFDPYGDHPPLSFSWLEVTKPVEDGIEVIYGESATVEVKVTGHKLKDLILEVAPSDGSRPPRELPMSALDKETFVASLDDIREPLTVYARSKNNRSLSPRREIAVELIPQLTGADLEITPPAYTGLPPRKQKFRFAGLQALEGSTLTFKLRSNRPLGDGSLIATLPGTDQKELKVALNPSPDGPANEVQATLPATDSGRLTFELRDIEDRAPETVPTAALTVSRDLSPAIAFLSPNDDSFIVEDHIFKFSLGTSDDYGIRKIRTFIAINEVFGEPVERSFDGVGPRRDTFEREISLAELGAKPGDIITLSGEVIDNCPTAHLTRTGLCQLEVISTEQYNEFLRKQTDVAEISGKYEDLLTRFEELVEEQKKLAEEGATPKEQEELNKKLEDIAKEMEEFGRENPVYDFEKDLQDKLKQMAQDVRDSVAQNQEAVKSGDKDAAKDHHERLANEQKEGEEQIERPLEDLATLHELIKDFNEFQDLYEKQKELKEQTKRFEEMKELKAQDRMSLKQLAPQQREVARALEDLKEKLEHHAELAEAKFPRAAQSARDLAQGIERGSFPRLGRQSSQAMVAAEGDKSHEQAANLEAEMAKLIGECKGGTGECKSEGFDQYLKLSGSKPGNSFSQMMQSLKFSPFGGNGGSGSGMSGSMASGGKPGQSRALMGGEARMPGAIAGKMAGRKGLGNGNGQGGGPVAKVDRNDEGANSLTSTRQTETPETQAILREYQNLTDAYFRTLTKPE